MALYNGSRAEKSWCPDKRDVIVRDAGVYENYGRRAKSHFDLWNGGTRHGFNNVHPRGHGRPSRAGESGVREAGKACPAFGERLSQCVNYLRRNGCSERVRSDEYCHAAGPGIVAQ